MKRIIVLIGMLLTISASAFAEREIYQARFTMDTCMVIHTKRNGYEKYDFYSEANFFGDKYQVMLVFQNNTVTLAGRNFESFCSGGVAVSTQSDKMTAKCSVPKEGVMTITKNQDGSLSAVNFSSGSKRTSCGPLIRTE